MTKMLLKLTGFSVFRPYWRCYYANTDAIIYVIDASDHDRLQTSRAELLTMLAEEELKGVPVLVFSNKQVRFEALSRSDKAQACYYRMCLVLYHLARSQTALDWPEQKRTGNGAFGAVAPPKEMGSKKGLIGELPLDTRNDPR
jgi:hypothetical protein